MSECIFCKIAAGELPGHKIYEDDNYLAFLDIRPLNPGHTLVIPKKHYRWVWDMPANRKKSPNIGDYFEIVGKIAQAIKRAFQTEYIVALVFGEEIDHAHVWLVPRLDDDGHGEAIYLGNVKRLGEKEMKAAAEKIKREL